MNFHCRLLVFGVAAAIMCVAPTLAKEDNTFSYSVSSSSSSSSATTSGGTITTTISTPERTQTTVTRGNGLTHHTVSYPPPPLPGHSDSGSFSFSSSSSAISSENGGSISSTTVSTPGRTQTTITKNDGTHHTIGVSPPPPPPDKTITVFSSDFSSGSTSGFVFASDLFKGTKQPMYSKGGHYEVGKNSGLKILLGGGEHDTEILDMSGGWYRSIQLPQKAKNVIITFKYSVKLSLQADDEEKQQRQYVEILGRFGDSELGSILRFQGGDGYNDSDSDNIMAHRSGINTFRTEMGPMESGKKILTLGGYLNCSSDSTKVARILFLDIKVEAVY